MTSTHTTDTLTFTARLGQALARYGAPAHRVEDVLHILTHNLDAKGVFSAGPSLLLMEFWDGQKTEVRMRRIHSNEIDLSRLLALDRLFNQVSDKNMTPSDGLIALEEIIKAPPRFKPWVDCLAFALTGAAATPMFGGGVNDMLLGFISGASVGIVTHLAHPRLAIPLGGFVAAFLVTLLSTMFSYANIDAVTLSAIIVLVPGFTITAGVAELVSHNVTAGVSRLGGALVTALSLSFGVLWGSAVGSTLVDTSLVVASSPAPHGLVWAMVFVAAITISILFRAPFKQWGWILLTSALTFGAIDLASASMRPDLAVFIGGLTLGCASNLHARLKDVPTGITRMPGLLFLVPGSLSFLSIQAVMSGQSEEAMAALGQLTLVAIALVMSLVVAGSLVPPRKAL